MSDQIFDGVLGSIKQHLPRELAEECSEFILLYELLGLLIAIESLLFVHCSYIKLYISEIGR